MHPGLLVLGGFLLGSAGLKAVQSETAHRAYVRTTVCALQAKSCVEKVVDEAKAQCDDIMAEARYIQTVEAAEREAKCECGEVIIGQTVIDEDGTVAVAEEEISTEEK